MTRSNALRRDTEEPATLSRQLDKLFRQDDYEPIRAELRRLLLDLLRGRTLPPDIWEELDEYVQGVGKESRDEPAGEQIAFLRRHFSEGVLVFVRWLDIRQGGPDPTLAR